MKLNPYLVEKIWGGRRIAKMKGISDSRKLGESWEVSTLTNQSSRTASGPLSEIASLPFLVKFIETTDNLSIQVHPGDDYAKAKENSLGKSECWYILDAKPGAGVYLGLKKGVSKNDLEETVRNNGAVDELMNFYEVSKGNFIYVPSGTIHSIGKDVFLLEAQQASGITYRFWDWNRLGSNGKPRELHIDKALRVVNKKSDYKVIDNFNEFEFKNITMKKIDHRLKEIQSGSITILEGLCNKLTAGNSFYIQHKVNLRSSIDFKGIWVDEKRSHL